nr:MAG TPA: hypothetical protein [Caudoviricetes sp.]
MSAEHLIIQTTTICILFLQATTMNMSPGLQTQAEIRSDCMRAIMV